MMRQHPRSALFPYTTFFRSYVTPWLDSKLLFLTGGRLFRELSKFCRRSVVLPAPELGELPKKSPPRQKQERSEEHTSELQSHLNIVCRLLLEKKKNPTIRNR